MATDNTEHVCNGRAICFQCFRAGMERARARREAWAQRSLPFDGPPARLTPRAIAHRQQMLDHLAKLAAGQN
jgi:hypothetical protein